MNKYVVVLLSVMFLLVGCGGSGGAVSSSSSSTVVAAPSMLSYTSPNIFIAEEQITALGPTVSGTVTSYNVAPALPAGLSLNATTGQITGTPTTASDAASYTITALNAGGSSTFDVSITVNPPPPTAPLAPAVTTSYGVKQITLDWSQVAGATFYRVLKQPTSGAGYMELAGDITANTYTDSVSVHLTDWINTSYIVEACNVIGCTASSMISALDATQAIGHLKTSNKDDDMFGYSVALSADGATLAIGAPGAIPYSFVIQPIGTVEDSGTVYIFTRIENTWSLQATVKASNPKAYDQFGTSISLSADGTTLAVGATLESSNATGINGDQEDDSAKYSGAVYVFTHTNNTWAQKAYIKASNTGGNDQFGSSVALSADGTTLAVGAPGEASNAIGINGDQQDNSAFEAGAVYVFIRTESTWSQQAYIKASSAGEANYFGTSLALSTDGDTLAVGAPLKLSNATGIDGNQDNNFVRESGTVYIFKCSENNWSQQAYVTASNSKEADFFGGSVALSSDGATLAVGAQWESSNATGINGNQEDESIRSSGAVYIFTHTGNIWVQQTYVKASNTEEADFFGTSVALSSDGAILAVGAPWESSNSTGINGNQQDNSAQATGAAYLFTRMENNWTQQAYVKASNTGEDSLFGESVALSADGTTMAVGAPGEDMNLTNIDDGEADSPVYGAVYIY